MAGCSKFTMDGKTEEEEKIIEEQMFSILKTTYNRLFFDDHNLRSYRRSLGVAQFIKKKLIPMITFRTPFGILQTAVQILVSLTMPTESLLKSSSPNNVQYDLDKILESAKVAFLDPVVLRVILERISIIMQKNDDVVNPYESDFIKNTLMLLRNILHIPLSMESNIQNQLIWNLHILGGTEILIDLMVSNKCYLWSVAMVQLLAVLYKDQDVSTIMQLLECWLKTSQSESSDDNESNTSPKAQSTEDFPPVLTSDSSDYGSSIQQSETYTEQSETSTKQPSDSTIEPLGSDIARKTTLNKESKNDQPKTTETPKGTLSSGEMSDYGYGTQIETQAESVSTSSNEDEHLPQKRSAKTRPAKGAVGAKLAAVVPPRESKLRRLIKRNRIKLGINAPSQCKPTDEDITHILKEFTIHMLSKNAFDQLVKTLHDRIMDQVNNPLVIDTSHFFWLVTYFLKLATHIQLDLTHLKLVLSTDILSYLAYEAINQLELLKICIHSDEDVYVSQKEGCFRRMYLVVTALTEFLNALSAINRRLNNQSDSNKLHFTNLQQYLLHSENIRNILLFLILNWDPKLIDKQFMKNVVEANHNLLHLIFDVTYRNINNSIISEYLTQFANFEIMFLYGELLSDFETNSDYLNDSILTMMHHVAGSLEKPDCLFQNNILNSFITISKKNDSLIADWKDLIEFIVKESSKYPNEISTGKNYKEWNKKCDKMSSAKIELDLKLVNEINKSDKDNTDDKSSDPKRKIEEIATEIRESGYDEYIQWLQLALVDASYAKFRTNLHPILQSYIVEPVPYHYAIFKGSIPIVPWNVEHIDALGMTKFLLLIVKMGLELNSKMFFPRIPYSWTPKYILDLAILLGPFVHCVKEKYDAWLYSDHQINTIEIISEVEDQLEPVPISTAVVGVKQTSKQTINLTELETQTDTYTKIPKHIGSG